MQLAFVENENPDDKRSAKAFSKIYEKQSMRQRLNHPNQKTASAGIEQNFHGLVKLFVSDKV
ncbi:hypothetical protein ACGO3R_08900 [Lactococcus lactis]